MGLKRQYESNALKERMKSGNIEYIQLFQNVCDPCPRYEGDVCPHLTPERLAQPLTAGKATENDTRLRGKVDRTCQRPWYYLKSGVQLRVDCISNTCFDNGALQQRPSAQGYGQPPGASF